MADHDTYATTTSPHSGSSFVVSQPPSSEDNPLAGQYNVQSTSASARLAAKMSHQISDVSSFVYSSYAGVDIVAQLVLPNDDLVTLGELQTISYSTHRENAPVRLLGHTNAVGFVKGQRTYAGSMIFTVFNSYAFYRLRQFQTAIQRSLYPTADMLPPIDIVLTFSNETGAFSKLKLYGVTFVDEGGTMSVDDLITEQTYSYMARGMQPMTGYAVPESI